MNKQSLSHKVCTICKLVKLLTEFGINGSASECKKCFCARNRVYSRTKKGLATKMHSHQRYTSRKRRHSLPSYSLIQLREWLFNQKIFHELYDEWVSSGYRKDLKPSCDRLDDYKPYSFDNLRLVTWRENLDSESLDKINGANRKQLKAVKQVTKDNIFVSEYYSISEAHRKTGVSIGNISSCCSGDRNYAGGFKWELA